MKAFTAVLTAFLVLGGLATLSMPVEAAASAVPGVRASVLNAGDPAFVDLRWALSPNDSNPNTGAFTYNVTVDAGSGWVNLGPASGAGIGFEAGGGFQRVIIEFGGATINGTFNITADDGSGAVDSCTVTVNTATQWDYSACGSMVTTWQGYHCLPRHPEPAPFGFNYHRRVASVENPDGLLFGGTLFTGSQRAVAGLDLPGDSLAYTFHYSLRLAVAGISQVYLSFDSAGVSATSAPGANINTGTGANAIILEIQRSGNDEAFIRVLRTLNGNLVTVATADVAGTDVSEYEDAFLRVDPYAGVFQFSVGGTVYTFPWDTGFSAPPNGTINSVWITGPDGNTQERYDRTGATATSSLCLTTLPASQGGSTGLAGQGIEGLPGFEGEGGRIGAPMFPGLNMTQAAEDVGMDLESWGLVVAGILLLALVLGGFALARVPGAAVGAVAWLPLAGLLSLVPLWVIVVVFLLAAAGVVIGFRGGNS